MMWEDLLGAIALVMVIEGIMPALTPRIFRKTLRTMSEMNDRFLRVWGLLLMVLGAFLLYTIKS